jgi:3-deoxy-D-manno-octulosonic-acid transferase
MGSLAGVRKCSLMSARLWLWLYSLLMSLLRPLVVRKLRRRSRDEPLYGQAMAERWGHYEVARGQGFVWVHAVSLGETRVAALLLKGLRAQWPGVQLLLTHGTATGRELGRSLLQPGDVQVWQPWDTPQAVQRFLDHFQPRVGLLMETEVWPNWVDRCRASGVPLVLVNARLSERSMRQAQRLSVLSHAAYGGLKEVWAQTEDDARRLRALGAPVTAVLGNLKFDVQVDESQQRAGQAARRPLARPVVALASSREGEEPALLQALSHSPDALARACWLIVPRHPQRFDEVAELIQSAGFQAVRRSQFGSLAQATAQFAASEGPTVLLGDSLGEMGAYSALAHCTLMGGSFEPLGGQNLIEPLAYGSPVVVGPHTFNFAQATEEALQAGVATRVSDWTDGVQAALTWTQQMTQAPDTSQRCRNFVRQHAGAVSKSLDRLSPWLS